MMTENGDSNEQPKKDEKLTKKRQETEILTPINFDLTDTDLEDIAAAKSKVVPNLPDIGKTAYTIENAPVAKAIQSDYLMEVEPQLTAEESEEEGVKDKEDKSSES
ncbi:MAG: hypothetical protein P1V97_11055 [Planctomycetota bacterium]|nr:hypothetical protein [Planctomycetota bacterium]